MARVMVEGAKVADVERPRLLEQADISLAPLSHVHVQKPTPEQRQAGVEKRRPAVGVPPIVPRPYLQNLRGSIDQRVVGEIFVEKRSAVRQVARWHFAGTQGFVDLLRELLQP